MAIGADTAAENADGTQADQAATGISQDEVNRIVAKERDILQRRLEKRAAQAAEQAVQAFREEHGLDDDALQKMAGGGMANDLRVARAAATKAERRAAELEKTLADYRSRAHATIARAAVQQAAVGAVDPSDVWLHLQSRVRLGDGLEIVVLDDDGEPGEKTIEQLVEGLLAAKPHLAKPRAPVSGAGSGRPASETPARGGEHRKAPDTAAERIARLAAHRELFERG